MRELYPRSTRSTGPRRGEPLQVGGRDRGHVRRRPGADPDDLVLEERPVDQRPRDGALRKRRDRAGSESRRMLDLLGTRGARAPRLRGARDELLVGAPVARDERQHVRAVAHEDERLDDLPERASDRPRRISRRRRPLGELLDQRVSPRRREGRRRRARRFRQPHGVTYLPASALIPQSNVFTGDRREKIGFAETEAVFREVNEVIAETAERFEADDAEFVCECGDVACAQRVAADLDAYDRIRRDPTRFILVDGHEREELERVVDRRPAYGVVEKYEATVAEVARRRDPRASSSS